MRFDPRWALGGLVGAALLASGADAGQSTTAPPRDPKATPSPQTDASPNRPARPTAAAPDAQTRQTPSQVEQLAAELLRRAQEEAARQAKEEAARAAQTGKGPVAQAQTGREQAATEQPAKDQAAKAQADAARPRGGSDGVAPPVLNRPPERQARPVAGVSQTTVTPPPPGGSSPSGATPTPPRRPGAVYWPDVLRDQKRRPGERSMIAAGGKLDPSAVDKTRIPILVPTSPALVAKPRLYSFGDYYSLNLDQPGLTVELTGTRVFGPTPKGLTKLPVEGSERVSIQRTVDGQLLSFTRYDLLYTIEIRCDSPRDPRCFSDALVRQIYAQTNGVILGKAARVEAGLEAK